MTPPPPPDDASSPAHALIEKLKADGRIDSRGGFSLDRDKAREKLRAFQHEDPLLFLLELVQAAHAQNATTLRFDIDADDIRLSFDGKPFTTTDFDLLYDAILSESNQHPTPRKLLAFGLNAAMALEPKHIHIESGDGRTGAFLTLAPDTPDAFGALEPTQTPPNGTTLHIRLPFRLKTLSRALQDRAGKLPEERLLRERCAHAHAHIDLEGARISHGLAFLTGRAQYTNRHVAITFTGFDHPAELRLIAHGAWLATHTLPDFLPGTRVAAVADPLTKDISQHDFVRDPAYDTLIQQVRIAELYLLAQLVKAQPTPQLHTHILARLCEPYAQRLLLQAKPDGPLAPLLDVALWRDLHDTPIPVRALLHDALTSGLLLYTTNALLRIPPTTLPATQRTRILHLSEPALRHLQRAFGAKRLRDIERHPILLAALEPHADSHWWTSSTPRFSPAVREKLTELVRVPSPHNDTLYTHDALIDHPQPILAIPDTAALDNTSISLLRGPLARRFAPEADTALLLHVEPFQRVLLRALLPDRIHDALPPLAILDHLQTTFRGLDGVALDLQTLLEMDAPVLFAETTPLSTPLTALPDAAWTYALKLLDPGGTTLDTESQPLVILHPDPGQRALLELAFGARLIDATPALVYLSRHEALYAQPPVDITTFAPPDALHFHEGSVTGYLVSGSAALGSQAKLYVSGRELPGSSRMFTGVSLFADCRFANPDADFKGYAEPEAVHALSAGVARALLELFTTAQDADRTMVATALFESLAPTDLTLDLYQQLLQNSPDALDLYTRIIEHLESGSRIEKRLERALKANALTSEVFVGLGEPNLRFVWLDTLFPRQELPLHERILYPHEALGEVPLLKSSRGRMRVKQVAAGLLEHGSLSRWASATGISFWPSSPALEGVFDRFVRGLQP